MNSKSERGARPFGMSPVSARRFVIRCVALGVALAMARRLLLPVGETERALVVHVDAGAPADEVARAEQEAMLLDVATRAGWARSDGVVRARMLSNLSVVEDVTNDPNRAVEIALAMGLHEK